MANNIPKDKRERIFELVYDRADAFGYCTRNRPDNSMFMNSLVNDPEIGGVLSQYMPTGEVRTYVKDTILNRYTKDLVKRKMATIEPIPVFQMVFEVDTLFVGQTGHITVCRASNNDVYVLSTGTYLKWETALRKALEYIASKGLSENHVVHICLGLVVINDDITSGDKKAIEDELSIVNTKAFFIG